MFRVVFRQDYTLNLNDVWMEEAAVIENLLLCIARALSCKKAPWQKLYGNLHAHSSPLSKLSPHRLMGSSRIVSVYC